MNSSDQFASESLRRRWHGAMARAIAERYPEGRLSEIWLNPQLSDEYARQLGLIEWLMTARKVLKSQLEQALRDHVALVIDMKVAETLDKGAKKVEGVDHGEGE